jgi:hypothetical protein
VTGNASCSDVFGWKAFFLNNCGALDPRCFPLWVSDGISVKFCSVPLARPDLFVVLCCCHRFAR